MRYDIFGSGGGQHMATQLGVPFMGEIPLVPAIREGGDTGVPLIISQPNSPHARVYHELAGALAGRISVLNLRREVPGMISLMDIPIGS